MERFVDLSKTSTAKKKLILEALELYYQPNLEKSLKEAGWEYVGNGSFKRCFKKKSIVIKIVKYTNEGEDNEYCKHEIVREFQQFTIMPKEYKKYFARIYVYDRSGLLIQDKVFKTCTNRRLSCAWNKIPVDLRNNCNDWGHNHGYNLLGNVKIFDWVYCRNGFYLNNKSTPLEFPAVKK